MMARYYYSFRNYLDDNYGERVRRIPLDAGFNCPHKDEKGRGCVYCNGQAFSPFAGRGMTLREQIELAMRNARKKGSAERFIAYFQSGTNTYASPEKLMKTYDVIRGYPDIMGLYISTRPDCVDEQKLSMIAEYAREYDVWIEYGIQTRHDRSLRVLNRGHWWRDSVRAVRMTAEKGINVGAHLILGLPGEDRYDMISTAEAVARLPVSGIKLHVLHVLKNTPMEEWHGRGDLPLMTEEEYVRSVCDVLEHIPPEVVVMRLVPGVHGDLLRAPFWIKDKHALIDRIRGEFEQRATRQGSYCT